MRLFGVSVHDRRSEFFKENTGSVTKRSDARKSFLHSIEKG
jgi:hypothetical protein